MCLQLYVQSTDTSRTLMSATALLEGLYPSTEAALWDPVPVHTRPLDKDPVRVHKHNNQYTYTAMTNEIMK